MLRITIFLLLILSILTQSYYIAALLFISYMLWFTGYEIVILAMLIDGYYGAFYNFPTLTVMTFLLFTLVTYLKKLLLYTGGDEVIS